MKGKIPQVLVDGLPALVAAEILCVQAHGKEDVITDGGIAGHVFYHTSYAEIILVVCEEGFADRVFVAEIFFCGRFGNDDRIIIQEGPGGVAAKEAEVKN